MTALRHNTTWIRDARNPVLPPQDPEFDSHLCMNPWVVGDGAQYQLYYAGEGEDGRRRICLATAPRTNPAEWTRHGPQFDRGEPGDFDGAWCVLPHVVDPEPGRRRIYYTGNSGIGRSLDRFPGLGLAESVDGGPYVKHPSNPVLPPSRIAGTPDELGMAGGSVIRVPGAEREWRFYYTGCPTVGDDVFLDQQKTVCLATSDDGITWHKEGAVMTRRTEYDYEDIAVAGPVVRQHRSGLFQMWYSAIGTRWGYYSICYAESGDGLVWNRGEHYGENLQLGPARSASGTWDGQMVEYPSVIDEAPGLRLFYVGNGYGRTGIGTARSAPLRAVAQSDGSVRISDLVDGHAWTLTTVATRGGTTTPLTGPWQGPDPDATVWSHRRLDEEISIRHVIRHTIDGLHLDTAIGNESDHDIEICVEPVIEGSGPGLEASVPVITRVPARTTVEVRTAIGLSQGSI